MKAIATFVLVVMCSTAYTQLEHVNPSERYRVEIPSPSNIERYGIDYKIKDFSLTDQDSSLVEQIDLSSLEQYRSEFQDVEVIDNLTGLTIILFHERKGPGTIINSESHEE